MYTPIFLHSHPTMYPTFLAPDGLDSKTVCTKALLSDGGLWSATSKEKGKGVEQSTQVYKLNGLCVGVRILRLPLQLCVIVHIPP